MNRFVLSFYFLFTFVFADGQHFNFNRISVEEGLAQPSLYALEEDDKGRLWIGLEDGGVQIYDGYSVHSLKLNVQYGKDIRCLYRSTADAMWIGSVNEGVTVYTQDSVYQYNSSNGLKSNHVRAFAEDYDGRMWVGTIGGGISVFDEGEIVKSIGFKEGVTSRNVKSLLHSKKGEMWVGSTAGLHVFRDFRRYKFYDSKSHFEGGEILSIKEDGRGVIWVGTDHGLFIIKDGEVLNSFEDEVIKKGRIKSILIDSDSSIWVGTKSGLAKISLVTDIKYKVVWYSRQNGLSSNRIRCLLKDRSGAIWVGTYFGGVNRFFNESFSLRNHTSGLSDDIISSIAEKKSDNSLWVGTYGAGLNIIKDGEIRIINSARGLSEDNVNCILHLPNDLTFVGTDEGVNVFNGDELDVLDTYDGPYRGEEIVDIAGDSNVVIALTNEHELIVINPQGKVEIDSVLTQLLQAKVLAKVHRLIYHQGKFYLLSSNQIKVFSIHKREIQIGKTWDMRFPKNIIPMDNRMIGYNNYNQFFYLSDNSVQYIDSIDPDKSIKFLVWEKGEDFWIGIDQKIEKWKIIHGEFKSIRSFDYEEGFIGLQAYENAALINENGDLVLGTIKGLFKAEKNSYQGTRRDLKVYLNSIEYGSEGAVLNLDEYCSSVKNGIPQDFVLPYNRNELKFEVRSFHLKNPAEVHYKFVLTGDEYIVREGTSNKEYFHLNAGEYTLEVFAKTQWGEWSSEPLSIKFSVTMVFWKKPSFYVFGSLIIIAVVFLFLYTRSRKLERDKVKLEGLVEERTQDLQDEQEKSEALLLNILPHEVATELKTFGKAKTKKYQNASVLFTDFKGFTTMSANMEPVELVSCLDEIFKNFDEIIVRNRLEKIKTIGDAYMCASGIPEPDEDHALNIVIAGLQIVEYMKAFNRKQKEEGKPTWEIRVGIHSGELIAGVVGKTKFAYDIWGDTVNVASRMESNGEPGRVNVSRSTYDLVEAFFDFETRGEIAVKNRGELEMFFIKRLKTQFSKDELGVVPTQETFST